MRYHVYGLHGDDKRELPILHNDDEALAVSGAILMDSVGLYGRTIVQDSVTGDIVAVFESGKPIDPSTL